MHLYGLTLQRASQITQAIHGNFAGTKQQLILLARGKILELVRPDANTGKVIPILSTEVFGIVRSLVAVRLTGGSKDYIVVGSDSGRITILEFNPEKVTLDRVHMETFGKSGCRRIVPGQYLAYDPKGRAVMIAAVEKQKLVYILNRDSAARLTISSPLEAHKSNSAVYSVVGLDVGFENPVFACLEMNYEEGDDDDEEEEEGEALFQTLTFYELDLGLNHVVRKESILLEDRANLLIPVPGGSDGPSGVLVCSENYITWRNTGEHDPVRVRIPSREGEDPERTTLITASAVHKHKSMFFFLLQTEYGDIFKLTMTARDNFVQLLELKYFDTVPVANSICLLKNGLLFVAAEFGNHALYQIQQLGENEDEPSFTSIEADESFTFRPRGLLNLLLMEEVDSLMPVMACQMADLAHEDSPQLYCASGRGPRSSLKTLRHGLEVSEIAVSDLPGVPNNVWTVRTNVNDDFDAYIVVSFNNTTIVLSIGDTVEEVTDSGFLTDVPTMLAARVGDDSIVQIHSEGVRHIRADKRVNEWKAPHRLTITHCTANERQVAVTLGENEIVYFELDRSGQLNEYSERMTMPAQVNCLSIGPVPVGAVRSSFLAAGLADNTARVVSLDPADTLQPRSMQALPGPPSSVLIIEMSTSVKEHGSLHLNVGLENGVLLRTLIDVVSGDLSDTRTRYLGARPVQLTPILVQGLPAMVALSSRPWISYMYQGHTRLTPLSCEALEHVCQFSSEQCPEGIVGISRNTMRILAVARLGNVFNQTTTALSYTPRKMIVDKENSTLMIVEGDHNAARDNNLEEDLDPLEFGRPQAGDGRWTSNIRIVDPVQSETLSVTELEENEMATCIAKVEFLKAQEEGLAKVYHVVVGVVKDWNLATNEFSAAYLNTYLLMGEERQTQLVLIHKTPVDFIPGAVLNFHGRVLVGVGKLLRLYDLGKKKLLRKCENKHLPSPIVGLSSSGSRIVVSDLRESVIMVKYKPADNQLVIFADDVNPHWTTTTCFLDHSTVALADKFGNVHVVRLPASASDDVDEDPTGSKALWDRGLLNGAAQKLQTLVSYYVGETILSLQTITFNPSGSECIAFATMAGAVGILAPFSTKEDVQFFQHLEMHMRAELPPLCGRDHLAFRSYYLPCKATVDGDLCELYNTLEPKQKKQIADELSRSPADVAKRLEDFRNKFAF